MKDTRKLSVIYFTISMVLLSMLCFGCENELEENQEYNMMILTVCYFLGGQNKYEVTKEFINDTYESKRNYNNHKFDLDLEIKNGFIARSMTFHVSGLYRSSRLLSGE